MYNNWYVVQVQAGNEEKIVQYCQTFIPKDILEDCFVLKYKHLKRYLGDWHEVEEVLFKGYVFMITDHVNDLFYQLKEIPGFTKLLGNTGDIIYPIYEEEAMFLQRFGKSEHTVEVSSGVIEGDKIYITQGPLVDSEGIIKKIDRHKRIAYVEIQLFNQKTTTQVGLEIVSKKA